MKPPTDSVFLSNLHHAYAQTDGTYAFPNSREGDMLRTAKREIETLLSELDVARAFHGVAVAELNYILEGRLKLATPARPCHTQTHGNISNAPTSAKRNIKT